MAVLTADRITAALETGLKSYPVGVDILYKGGMVVLDTAGYAVPAADTQGNTQVVGIADEKVDNSGGSAGDKKIRVRSGRSFKLVATAIVQADVGKMMYVVDDQTFDADWGTNGIKAGVLTEFVSATSGWVFVPTPSGAAGGKGIINLDLFSAREISSNDIPAVTDTPSTNDPDGFGGLLYTASTPALERINGATDKGVRIRWAAANVVAVQFAPVALPSDLDDLHDISVHIYAEMGGATDTPLMGVAAFFGVGDADAGGNTLALADAVGERFVDIAAADVLTHPNVLHIELTPAAHGTDALDLYAAWIEYSKRP